MKEYVLPILLIFAGFIGTHLLSEARERRKELRAMLDKLFTRLRELEDQARTFHTSSAYDQEAARQLREAVQQVSRQFSRCRVVTELAPFQQALIDWRRAITLRNFDSSTFQTQAWESELIADISHYTFSLEDTVEQAYLACYPHTFPYFAPTGGWQSYPGRAKTAINKWKGRILARLGSRS